jgi:energy-coupling factor transport system ATP-binding protein
VSNSKENSIIRIENLIFDYQAEDGSVRALDSVSLDIEKGTFTSIIGRNGSGKSTLAKTINALLTPTEGCVIVGGYDTREEEYIWEIRRMAGMVFQNPDNQLVSAVVEDDVAFGPENLGLPREEIIDRIRTSLESVNMYEHRKMAPHKLSGGQKQRVAIAGVVAMKPDIIIFDEPTAMLDPEGRGEVLEIAARLNKEGVTVLLITHFMEETTASDRVIIMDRGRICLDGPPREVYAKADEIRKLGLMLPFAVDLSDELRDLGILPQGGSILTEEELAEAVIEVRTEVPLRAVPGSEPRNSDRLMESWGEPIIVCEHLSHIYNKGLAYETNAVDDVSFSIGKGEYVAVIGHTGSGKSTLIQHLNGLLKPTSGTVTVKGANVSEKNAAAVGVRKTIGMIFQYPEYQLFEETVYKDIAFGPKNLGVTEEETDKRVKEAMAVVNMGFDEFAHRSPFELSGGQKRMIAIAGVLAMQPEVLVLDEPTAGLDPKSHEEIVELIEGIHEKTGSTIVIVSHNMDDVARLADRIFVMAAGRIVKTGTPREVFADEQFLKNIGLGVPRATAFSGRLASGGLMIPYVVLSQKELLEALTV